MSYSQGFASGTDVPIEHLDFSYISTCTKASYVEKLVRILRSNKEGHYPELLQCAENKLKELDPASKLLLKSESVTAMRDLPQQDFQKIAEDLQQWEEKVRDEDQELSATLANKTNESTVNGEVDHLPPVRRPQAFTKGQPTSDTGGGVRAAKGGVKARDFKAWDKFDADEECAKVDAAEVREESSNTEPLDSGGEKKVFHRSPSMTQLEKEKVALNEKNKGNEAFRSGDFREALSYYSRSLQLHKATPTQNNRALTYIKLERYEEALEDCEAVLRAEPSNTKALFRKGMASVKTSQWPEAVTSLELLLKLEPNNKKGRELLTQARDNLAASGSSCTEDMGVATEKKRGRQLKIEEDSEESKEREKGVSAVSTASVSGVTLSADGPAQPVIQQTAPSFSVPQVSKSVPMPTIVSELKEKGNDLFRRGQYGEASLQYTNAMDKLAQESEARAHDVSMATLLNNRAACELKNGNPGQCISDCSRSLDLMPVNIKALIRRAQAYEQLEKYRQAYVDNAMALELDWSMEKVIVSNTRIMNHLKEQDGPNWRQKLPQHSHQLLISQTRRQLQQNLATPTSSMDTPSQAAPALTLATPTPTSIQSTSTSHVSPSTESATPTASPVEPPGESAMPSCVSAPPTPPPPISTLSSLSEDTPQTKVTQSSKSTPITTPTITTPTSATPTGPSARDMFDKLKAKGNRHIQQGEYSEAVQCYTRCMEVWPDQVAAYTNRALCHIKLGKPLLAESDCSKALELEAYNVKALYRRAMARKSLAKFADSVKDLKQLLEVDSKNTVAKAEFEEVKKLWEKQLREMQAESRPPQGSGSRSTSTPPDKDKMGKAEALAAAKRLLATTKTLKEEKIKMEASKKSDIPATGKSSPKTTRSRTAGQKQGVSPGSSASSTSSPANPSSSSPTTKKARRRKVVVEEVNSKTGGLHRLSSQPAPRENRPVSRRQEKMSEKKEKSPMEEDQVRVAQERMCQTHKDASVDNERVEKALAEKERELETMRALEKMKQQNKTLHQEGLNKENKSGGDNKEDKIKEERKEERVKKESKADRAKEDRNKDRIKGKKPVGEKSLPSEVKKEFQEDPTLRVEPLSDKGRVEGDEEMVSSSHGSESSQESSTTAAVITTPYEFMQQWTSVPKRGQDKLSNSRHYGRILQQLPPARLPELITNKLEGHMLSAIITSIHHHLLPNMEYELCEGVLTHLVKVPRFQTVAMFLEQKEKEELRQVLAHLHEAKALTGVGVKELSGKYGL